VLDAWLASELPVVEVHLSNIHRRESFRQQSYVSQAAVGMICGFGSQGYEMALDAMARIIGKSDGG
jgi:3-dehydroquinate dehydratase-2